MTLLENFKRHPLTPNGLSIFRGVLGLIIPFLLFGGSGMRFAAFVLFIVGAITDYYDGYLARKHHGVSDTGKILDPSMDKILILGPLAAFAYLKLFSVWWIVPVFFREIIVTFCRIGWLREGKAAGAEQLGKLKLGVQVALTGVAMVHWFCQDFESLSFLTSLSHAVTWVLLPTCLFLTVVSGITFFYSNMELFETREFARFTAACGVGLIPLIPGTLGSLLGLVLIPMVAWNFWVWLFTFLALLIVGYRAVSRIDLSADKDPGYVVIDEVLGMFVSLAFIPLNIYSMVLGFLLFRLFDIVKPVPCRKFESLPGYWGILCDDLMAGVYTRLALLIILRA